LNASTFTARIAASTGADCAASMSAAVGTLSGPLHGGAPARVLPMLEAVQKTGDAKALRTTCLREASGSLASATGSTATPTRAPAFCATPPKSWAHPSSMSPTTSSRPHSKR